jgi:hypothetical protein
MLFAVRVCIRLLELKVLHVGRATRTVETTLAQHAGDFTATVTLTRAVSVNSDTLGRPPPTHGPDDDPVCGVTAQVRCKEPLTSSLCLRVRASLSHP